ncbi:HPF/RaiA family ribosome-associated protein [Pleurocapsales cyanobacterium LEGE 10410]|nr:HPF/RaiA family ribosome-associated protein [Pleurocapsales cyanobacterium LEGE 10410]
MKITPEITYRNLERTPAIDNLIQEKIAKLEQFCDYMNSCRIVVEKDKDSPISGSPYRVSIDITIPHSREIAVVENPDTGKQYTPLETVIRDAFEAARRQIVSISTEQQGERKVHPEQETTAIVVKLFAEQGYGFIKQVDTGKEVYFHRNSVTNNDFDRIKVGTGVRFKETMGEMGPQATTVQIVSQHGSGRSSDAPDAAEAPQGWG